MLNMMSYLTTISALVAVGDATDLTVPAIAAGVGVGAVAVALLARRRNKDDDEQDQTPPTQSKQSKHFK